jgi:hypothetical protein
MNAPVYISPPPKPETIVAGIGVVLIVAIIGGLLFGCAIAWHERAIAWAPACPPLHFEYGRLP